MATAHELKTAAAAVRDRAANLQSRVTTFALGLAGFNAFERLEHGRRVGKAAIELLEAQDAFNRLAIGAIEQLQICTRAIVRESAEARRG